MNISFSISILFPLLLQCLALEKPSKYFLEFWHEKRFTIWRRGKCLLTHLFLICALLSIAKGNHLTSLFCREISSQILQLIRNIFCFPQYHRWHISKLHRYVIWAFSLPQMTLSPSFHHSVWVFSRPLASDHKPVSHVLDFVMGTLQFQVPICLSFLWL